MLLFFLACGQILWGAENRLSIKGGRFKDSQNNTIYTQSASLKKKLHDKTDFLLAMGIDRVELPPVDAVSSASRPVSGNESDLETFHKTRFSSNVGLSQGLGRHTLSPFAYYSLERDYVSRSLGFNYKVDFNSKNTTLLLGYFRNDDQIGEENAPRQYRLFTDTGSLGLTQVATAWWLSSVLYQATTNDGFNNNLQRHINGHETLPQQRMRHSLSWRNHFYLPTRSSLQIAFGHYRDDWNVTSNSVDMRGFQYASRSIVLRLRYRYYQQTAATFDPESGFFSDDYKYAAFRSHLTGIKLIYFFHGISTRSRFKGFAGTRMSLKYEYYSQSNGFFAHIVQSGLTFDF